MQCKEKLNGLAEIGFHQIKKNELKLTREEQTSFNEICLTWNNLGPDYAEPENIYRMGMWRYGIYEWDLDLDRMRFLSSQVYLMHGSEQDNLGRELLPLSFHFATSVFLSSLVKFIHSTGCEHGYLDKNRRKWHLDIGQYRVLLRHGDKAGVSTPQGPHHDKSEFIASMHIGRHNISQEEYILFDQEQNEAIRASHENPLDMMVWDDKSFFHSVSEFSLRDPWEDLQGYRDVLIIGFNEPEFNPNFEGSSTFDQTQVDSIWPPWKHVDGDD